MAGAKVVVRWNSLSVLVSAEPFVGATDRNFTDDVCSSVVISPGRAGRRGAERTHAGKIRRSASVRRQAARSQSRLAMGKTSPIFLKLMGHIDEDGLK